MYYDLLRYLLFCAYSLLSVTFPSDVYLVFPTRLIFIAKITKTNKQ